MVKILDLNNDEIINNNQDYNIFLINQNCDNNNIKDLDLSYYVNFLLSSNEFTNNNTNEFKLNAIKNLSNYADSKFWLLSPLESFEFLLNEINSDKIKITDISYFLTNKKIFEGFTIFVNNYINSRKNRDVIERKKAEYLAKQIEIDKLISSLLLSEYSIK